MLLSCRVKKGMRRFGDSFLEERRVAFYSDRLRVMVAPGCLGSRDTWLRYYPGVSFGNPGGLSLSKGIAVGHIGKMGLPVGAGQLMVEAAGALGSIRLWPQGPGCAL